MTRTTCIAIIDASRARFFLHVRSVEPGGMRDTFDEMFDLVDPARRLPPSELFSDTRTNSNRSAGGRHYGFDDHANAHVDQLDVVFAREIAAQLDALVTTAKCTRVVLCASPHMLGTIRPLLPDLARRDIAIEELARDLVKLTPPELREALAHDGLLLPVPERPARAS